MFGGWLSVIAGAWFVIGRVMATTLTIGEIGRPVAENDIKAAWLELTYFYGLGASDRLSRCDGTRSTVGTQRS